MNDQGANDPGARAAEELAPAKPSSAELSSDERVLAAVSHGVTLFDGGLIGPLIVYLIKKDSSEFVAFQALQSLYFSLLFLGLTLVTCGLAAMVLVWPFMIFQVIAAFKVYEGTPYELPIVAAWARKRHPAASTGAPTVF